MAESGGRGIGPHGGFLTCLGLIVLIGVTALWSLHHNHKPWELLFVSPSGLDERDYLGTSTWGPQFQYTDLKNDEPLLLIGKHDFRAEVWDFHEGKRVKEIQFPVDEQKVSEKPGLDGVYFAAFVESKLAMIFDVGDQLYWMAWPNGDPVKLEGFDRYIRARAISPDGRFLAQADIGMLKVYDLSLLGAEEFVVDEPHWSRIFKGVNGSHMLHWTPDGKHLMFKDLSGIWLMDAEDGRAVLEIPELDYRRPWPHHADELSGYASQRESGPPGKLPRDDSKVAGIQFASIVDDGASVVVAFGVRTMHMFNDKSDGLLRKYDLKTGEVIWEQVTHDLPRSLHVSPDGQWVVLNAVEDFPGGFADSVRIHDVKTGDLNGEKIVTDAYNHYSARFALSPDGQSLVAGSNRTWVMDVKDRHAPFCLVTGSKSSEVEWLDRDHILTYGRETTARVFKRARSDAKFGLWVPWETWVLYALGIFGGLLLVRHAGDLTEEERGKPLPRALWWVVAFIAVCLGVSLAATAVDMLTREYYEPTYERESGGEQVFSLLFDAMCFFAVYQIMRLSRGWYLFALTWIVIGALGFLVLAIEAVSLLGRLQGAWGQNEMPDSISVPIYWHAWILKLSPAVAVAAVIVSLLLVVANWVLLRRPEVRRLFAKKPTPEPAAS